MEIGCRPTSRSPRTPSALCVLVAAAVLAAAGAVAAPATRASGGGSDLREAPSARTFASLVAGSTAAYGKAHRIRARVADVDCVRASSVEYMCSYAVTSPTRPRTCHLLQARWTPSRASLYTVTLAGRVKRCGTLREALRSLP